MKCDWCNKEKPCDELMSVYDQGWICDDCWEDLCNEAWEGVEKTFGKKIISKYTKDVIIE